MHTATADLVALSLLPTNWRPRIATDLRGGVPAGEILDRLLVEHGGPGRGVREMARRALDRAPALGIDAVGWDDRAYPPALWAIPDPPPLIWISGERQALVPPAVALVGSRAGSSYALSVAEHLAEGLAGRGLVVVSGMARGVDSAAHRGALRGGGQTVAVLGSGLDVIYPPEHQGLAREIRGSGALLSELPPGTPPHPRFFPLRNRIISGLVRAVVVIEAGQKSGSLITARCALEQGRDVLAVPGNILTGRNVGGHALLKDGAKLVETADDVVEEIGFVGVSSTALAEGHGPSATSAASQKGVGRPSSHDPVLAALAAGEPSSLDEIAERSGLDAARLLPRLFTLELGGRVQRVGGGRFVRLDTSC
jgi:DNA processing protein